MDPSGHYIDYSGGDPNTNDPADTRDDAPAGDPAVPATAENKVSRETTKQDQTNNGGLVGNTTNADNNANLGAVNGGPTSEEKSVLGIYRDPNKSAYYSDDPVIYEDKDMKYGGIVKGALKSEYGILGTVATGEFAEGSKKIEVYGTDEGPKSWEIFIMMETDKKDATMDWSKYEWSPHYISESEAMKLDVTRTAIEYLEKKEKYGK